MREIKFRGQRIDNNQWAYGYLVPVTTRGVKPSEYYICSEIRNGSIQGFPVYRETIGQFTGMKDKNGVPIWEGDIVRYRWTDERFKKNPRYTVGVVSWDEWDAGWSLKGFIRTSFRSERLEVLGNVYDNPELLNEMGRS